MTVQCNNRLRWRTAMILPAGCPHSMGLIVKKSKSLLVPVAGGQWLQMTMAGKFLLKVLLCRNNSSTELMLSVSYKRR